VSDTNFPFIAQWIKEGCPDADPAAREKKSSCLAFKENNSGQEALSRAGCGLARVSRRVPERS